MEAIAEGIPGAFEGAAAPPVIVPVIVNPIYLALQWIGFENIATRDRLRDEGFSTFDDLKSMKEKDIRDLAESYGRRSQGDGRYIFGIHRTVIFSA